MVAVECSSGLVQNLTSVVENELLRLGDQNRNEKLQNFSATRHSERKIYLRRVTKFMFCYVFKKNQHPNPEQLGRTSLADSPAVLAQRDAIPRKLGTSWEI